MKWINDVVFAILAAHVWGSLMLFVWLQAVKKLSKRGYSRALFWLLRCVVVAYLLPFGFCLLIAVDGYFRGWDGRLFEWTPIITVVNHALFIAWLIGLFFNFGKIWKEWRVTRVYLRDAFPADLKSQSRFREVCKEIKKRPGRVKLYQKFGLRCGITTGILRPRIVLPDDKLNPVVEKVTMIHELIHYKRRDLWFLYASKIIETIHWFNPLSRSLSEYMNQWNEYACDYESCIALGNSKMYAIVLCNVAEQNQQGLFSSIGTEPMTLSRRIEMMVNMQKARKKLKFLGTIAAIAVSFASVTSTFAATGVMAEGYKRLYDLTMVEDVEKGVSAVVGDADLVNESTETPEYPDNSNINPADYVNTGIVFNDVLPIDGYTVVEGEVDNLARGTGANFNWTLTYDYLQTSGYFRVSKGQTIAISGKITPVGKIIRVGIIEPNGARRCVYATGSFAQNFPVNHTGDHKVYAINDNSEVVNLSGGYLTY